MTSNTRIITSFSGRLYYTTGKAALESWQAKFQYPVTAYHEDSYENTHPLSGRHLCEVDKVSGTEYIDLFKADSKLKRIVNYPEFKKAKTYLNQNAPFFFRKIAALHQAASTCKESWLIWLDCDCFGLEPFSPQLLSFVNQHDICYLDRKDYPTESGVFFFNMKNPAVKKFIASWYNLYLTKKIFALPDWADHNAFDHLRLSGSKLKFGRLQSGQGRTLWFKPEYVNTKTAKPWSTEEGWKFIHHLKHDLKKIRVPVKSEATKQKNRGHLYISFGVAYDNLAAHSAAYLRKCSNLPIHVITNLTGKQRSKKWEEVGNITFRYFPGEDHDNREVKTALAYFSPFDETMYTDADSLTHSRNFIRPFKQLRKHDVLIPIYALRVNPYSIPMYQHAAFSKALKQLNTPHFNNNALFNIYGGGVCYFKKTKAVFEFFNTFNYYWRELGAGRDMPALAAAVAELKDKKCSFGFLSKEYNLASSKIVQSIHGNATSPHLPHYIPYRPDENGNWRHEPKRIR